MNSTAIRGLLAGVLVLGVAGVGHAQEAPKLGETVKEKTRADYEPIGARAGSFLVFPKLEVGETYNDNIFSTDSDERHDFITIISPSVAVNSDFARHALNLKLGADVGRYADYDAEDYEDYNASVDGRIDVLRDATITIGAGYKKLHEDRGDPDAASGINPGEYEVKSFDLGAKFKPNRISLEWDGSLKRSDYDDVKTTTGTTNNDDRDKDEYVTSLRVGYEIVPEFEAFVKGTYNVGSYDDAVDDFGFDRDSDGFEVVAGTAVDLTGLLTGDVFVGYMKQVYDDANLENISGPSAGISLTWNVTKLTTLKGNVSRTISDTTTANSPGSMTTIAGISAEHELRRNLILDGELKYTLADYESIARHDQTYDVSAGADYLLNRNFFARIEYSFRKKHIDVGTDYSENKFTINLGAQF